MRATAIFPLPNLRNLQTELDGMFQHFPFRPGFATRWSPAWTRMRPRTPSWSPWTCRA